MTGESPEPYGRDIMRFGLRHFGTLSMLAVSCAVLYFVLDINARLNKISIDVAQLNDGVKIAAARREVQDFISLNAIPYSRELCRNKNDSNDALCKVLVIKSFSNLSNTTDLWVALDAISVFSDRPNIPKSIRREITRYYADLLSSLDVDGALTFVSRNDDLKSMISVNNIYAAIMAQSVVCTKYPSYRKCQNGLTVASSTALKSLADLVVHYGPELAAYEMSNRLESVKILYSSGLIGHSTQNVGISGL